jgi:hypothetical protein
VERIVKYAYRPAFITRQIVNQITLLVHLVIKKLVTHRCLLYATIHEEFVQKVKTRFTCILFSYTSYRHLIELLVIKSGLFVVFSILLNIFVFQFVFWEIRDLNDAIGVLELGWDCFKDFHYVLETSVAHYLRLHHMQDC